MKTCTIYSALVAAASAMMAMTVAAHNDHLDRHRDKDRDIVTVAFGAGLNTAQPGNEETITSCRR